MYSKKHDGFKFWQSGYPRISSSIATLVGFFIGLMILSLQPTFAQNGKWTIYNTSNSYLPSNVVSCFAFDTKGNIWIGTKGGGIAKFNGTNWTVYTKNNSDLPDSVVTALAIDQQDNIFIGTNKGGLTKFNGSVLTLYHTDNCDILSNLITDLIFDSQGNL